MKKKKTGETNEPFHGGFCADDVNNHGGVSINIRCVKIIPLFCCFYGHIAPILTATVSQLKVGFIGTSWKVDEFCTSCLISSLKCVFEIVVYK